MNREPYEIELEDIIPGQVVEPVELPEAIIQEDFDI